VLVVLAARVTLAGARRLVALLAAYRLAAAFHVPAGDLAVLDDSNAHAYAVPGRPGRVVVSTGLLRRLDAARCSPTNAPTSQAATTYTTPPPTSPPPPTRSSTGSPPPSPSRANAGPMKPPPPGAAAIPSPTPSPAP